MTMNFNVTGSERKNLVQAIGRSTGVKPRYLGMPSMAYEIGPFTVDRNGTVECSGDTDALLMERLRKDLTSEGFVYETPELPSAATENATEGCGLVVSVPAESLGSRAWNNLTLILAAKGSLIKKALGVEELPVVNAEDSVSFPWFEDRCLTSDEIRTYTHFISALLEMARNQKRINAKEKETDNDKYAFRCFLLRLGFIGAEYKAERKILLRNLDGSSAFKGVSA
jgi:hypothetical protein